MANPDRPELPAAIGHALAAAIDITEGIASLPAVATIDWCDRAAACLTRIGRSGTALVIIGQVDDAGRVLSQDLVGVAAAQFGPGRARGVGPRIDRAAGQDEPRLVREEVGESAPLDGLRARAEKVSQVGWIPDGVRGVSAGALSAMPAGRNWRAGAPGRLWGEMSPADLLVGLAPLGEAESGRMVLVEFAPTPPLMPEAEEVAVLRAVLPVLARRAAQAVGSLGAGQWLTLREQAVLDRLVIGRSVKQIADELGRSIHTIHGNVKILHRKLGASNRGELISRALGVSIEARPMRRRGADAASSDPRGDKDADKSGAKSADHADGPVSYRLARSA